MHVEVETRNVRNAKLVSRKKAAQTIAYYPLLIVSLKRVCFFKTIIVYLRVLLHPRAITASIEPDKGGLKAIQINAERLAAILRTRRELILLPFDSQCSLLVMREDAQLSSFN